MLIMVEIAEPQSLLSRPLRMRVQGNHGQLLRGSVQDNCENTTLEILVDNEYRWMSTPL